jgi:hypothetical protein
MKKYGAWFFISAICTLGCSTLADRMQAPSSPASQVVTATSLKPAVAKWTVLAPEIDTVKLPYWRVRSAEVTPPPANATPNTELTPAISQKDGKAVSVPEVPRADAKNALKEAFCTGVRQIMKAIGDAEIKASERLAAACEAAIVFVKSVGEKGLFVLGQRRTAHSDPALQPDVSRRAWYCLAWIAGALFTSILAPLLVEFIKFRMGFGRPQPDRSSSQLYRF